MVSSFSAKIRTTILVAFAVCCIAVAISADFILRHEVRGKARRTLAEAGFSLDSNGIIKAIETGNLAIFEQFDKAEVPYSESNVLGLTPLNYAVAENKHAAVDALFTREDLIKPSIDHACVEGYTPLKRALEEKDFQLADRLLAAGADVNQHKTPGLPWLIAALDSDDVELQRYLLKNGVDVNQRGEQSYHALAIVARNNDLPLMEHLISLGADLSIEGCSGKKLLLEAILAKQTEEVDLLLGKGVDVRDKGSYAHFPLAVAADQDDLELMGKLVAGGADIEISGVSERTILLEAITDKEPGEVAFLLDNGVKVNEKGSHKLSPLAVAADQDDMPLIENLVSHGAKIDVVGISGKPLFYEALLDGEHSEIDFLLESGANPDVVNDKVDPLILALSKNDDEMRQILVQHGVTVDRDGSSGDHLVFEAFHSGDQAWLVQLIKSGVNVDHKSNKGETLLTLAMRAHDYRLVDFLIEEGANLNKADKQGMVPLDYAVSVGDAALTRTLVQAQAKVDWPKLATLAFNNRDNPTLSLLLNAGMPPNTAIGRKKERLFDVAVSTQSVDSARSLLRAGADKGDNFWMALKNGMLDLVLLFLQEGEDPTKKGPDGETPLNFALNNQYYSLVQPLLKYGALPNEQADGGKESWIAKTIRNGNTQIAMALLNAGVELGSERAGDGHSLLAWSIANGTDDITLALIKAGVDPNIIEPSPANDALVKKFKSVQRFQYYMKLDRKIRPLMLVSVLKKHSLAHAMIKAGAKNLPSSRANYPVSIASWSDDVRMMQILFGRNPDYQPRMLEVNLSSQRVSYFRNGQVVHSSICSTGMEGFATQTGAFVITQKNQWHRSNLYDAEMPYFMRLSCKDFGFHTGICPGYPASHGCIRLPGDTASKYFSECKLGDMVIIKY